MLNETYVIGQSLSCNNGTNIYYYGVPKEAVPAGESYLVSYEYCGNGTTFYRYANGTVEVYEHSWYTPTYPEWSDENCKYIKYETYTWANCNNGSSIQIMDTSYYINYTEPYIVYYEYTNTGYK